MRRLFPLVLRSWSLPFVVLALIAPGVAAFSLAGPQLGLAVGALTVAALVIVAARASYDEPIEVATSRGGGFRLLLLAAAPLEAPGQVAALRDLLAAGARRSPAGRARGETGARAGRAEVLVLAPARTTALARWASDLAPARAAAGDVLAVSLASLAAAEIEAAGRVGDGDPVQALADELPGYAADEVAVIPGPGLDAAALEEIRRRLDRPVSVLAGEPPRAPPASA